MKSVSKIALAALALAGCSSSNAASTTTAASVAPPTSPPTTTTITPTTTTASSPQTTLEPTSTTISPTTAPADPDAAAKADITARYFAFSAAADKCFSKPDACVLPDDLSQYANVDTDPAKSFTNYWLNLRDSGQRSTRRDLVEREVADVVLEDQDNALSTACVKNASVTVDSGGNVTDDRVGYWREDFVWRRIEGQWIIQVGDATGIGSDGDELCTFEP